MPGCATANSRKRFPQRTVAGVIGGARANILAAPHRCFPINSISTHPRRTSQNTLNSEKRETWMLDGLVSRSKSSQRLSSAQRSKAQRTLATEKAEAASR